MDKKIRYKDCFRIQARTRCPDTYSKIVWMKAQHEGALTPPCIVRKNPKVPHSTQQESQGDSLIRTTWYHYFLKISPKWFWSAAGVQNHCLKGLQHNTIETAQTTLRKLEDLRVRLWLGVERKRAIHWPGKDTQKRGNLRYWKLQTTNLVPYADSLMSEPPGKP